MAMLNNQRVFPVEFHGISMEDEIIQWTVQALRHPGSAAAHQFQAAQGAEGLSHI